MDSLRGLGIKTHLLMLPPNGNPNVQETLKRSISNFQMKLKYNDEMTRPEKFSWLYYYFKF